MEYLVTMTTHVPDGTPGQAVDDVPGPGGRTLARTGRGGAPGAPVASAAAAG